MTFPHFDPVIVQLGPLAVRWYGVMYLLGFVCAYLLMRLVLRWRDFDLSVDDISDMLFYSVFGVILGGRLGYVLFYNAAYYFQHPLDIPKVWHGGMSFHGGFLGVVTALVLFGLRRKKSLLEIGDLAAVATPSGLFFGRIGNFINAELWGRVTDVPWGIVFPDAGLAPRHPSQLYEAGLEGVLLLFVMLSLHRLKVARGVVMFSFITGYGICRLFVELFREPDAQIGFLFGHATMGQLLSLPMILIGVSGIVVCYRRKSADV